MPATVLATQRTLFSSAGEAAGSHPNTLELSQEQTGHKQNLHKHAPYQPRSGPQMLTSGAGMGFFTCQRSHKNGLPDVYLFKKA